MSPRVKTNHIFHSKPLTRNFKIFSHWSSFQMVVIIILGNFMIIRRWWWFLPVYVKGAVTHCSLPLLLLLFVLLFLCMTMRLSIHFATMCFSFVCLTESSHRKWPCPSSYPPSLLPSFFISLCVLWHYFYLIAGDSWHFKNKLAVFSFCLNFILSLLPDLLVILFKCGVIKFINFSNILWEINLSGRHCDNLKLSPHNFSHS